MTTTPQLTLFVTFHIQPDRIEEWKVAHRPVWKACAAEPECLYFDVFHDPEVMGRFRLVEVWKMARVQFEEEQLTKPYYEVLWQQSKPTWLHDMEIEYMERLGEGTSWKHEFLASTPPMPAHGC